MSGSAWDICVSYLQTELPAQQFNTWIRPLRAESADSVLRLIAPNKFVSDWVNDKYRDRIQTILDQNFSDQQNVIEITVSSQRRAAFEVTAFNSDLRESNSNLNHSIEPPVIENAVQHPPVVTRIVPALSLNGQELPEKVTEQSLTTSNEKRSQPVVSSPVIQKQDLEGGIEHKSNLNQDFTFDNFVVGKSNQLGLAAATQVAENPWWSIQPFVYIWRSRLRLKHT